MAPRKTGRDRSAGQCSGRAWAPLAARGVAVAIGLCAVCCLAGCLPASRSLPDQGRPLKTAATTVGRVSSSPAVTIRFAYWAVNRRETAVLQRLAKLFQHRHPRYRVELIGVPQRYYEKLQTLIVADECPDAFTANYGRLADFVRAGAVRDLRAAVAAQPDLARRYLPAAWKAASDLGRRLGRPGLWALPRDWPPAGMVLYNADLLAAAGVEPPAVDRPWSWAQFRAACEKIRDADLPGVYPTAVNLYPYSVFTWLRQAGAKLIGPDGRLQAHEPEVVDALRFLFGLWQDGLAPRPNPGRDDSFELFRAGRVAFVFGTFYNVQACRDIEDFAWGVSVPLKMRAHACSCLPTFVAVSARTRHIEAAWRWAVFLSLHGAEEYAREGVAAPAVVDALRPAIFLAKPPLQRARPAVLAAMKIAAPPPVAKAVPYERVIDTVREVLERAIAAGTAPDEAARQLARALARDQGDATK